LAKPYLSEATGLVGGHCPEVTRPVDMSEEPEGQRRVWRKPRQPNPPPIIMASSGTSQPPVRETKLKLVVDGAPTDEDKDVNGHASEITVLGSDGSQAIIIETSNALHEVEEDDKLSEVSSRDDDERAVAEMSLVNAWRTKNFLQHDLDFAYVFVDVEQAYSQAGRAVAQAWSRARLWVEPETVTEGARVSAREATATEVREVDDENMEAPCRKKVAKSPFLRQPGKDTKPEKTNKDKVRFIEPLAQLMMDCRVGHFENASATDKEIMTSLRHKVTHVVEASDIPTLHIAVTTADEVRRYFEYRAAHMGGNYVEPIVLQEFFCQSSARIRAINAVAWMCDNLHLGWPIDKVVKPDVREVSSLGMESKQAPAAQPGMLKALENAMEAAAENGDPTWLALLASWLQAMAKLRMVHLLRRSFPVKLYNGWMLFFCKQGKQEHDCAGFCWGVPSRTSSGYRWTQKFLAEYNKRRRSDVGRKMMGMIFRTDTREYLSSKAVNVSTINAVASVVDNPRLLATYSWKRMLPAIALHLDFSPAERLAIGDWKDTKAISDEDTKEDAASNWWLEDESPITVKYDEGKEGKIRVRRLICAEVLAILVRMGTKTFDEVPAQQWELWAGDAKGKVESKMREIRVCWRNSDVAEAVGVLKMKKYQISFPKHLFSVEHSEEFPCKGAHGKEENKKMIASALSSTSAAVKPHESGLLERSCGWPGAQWEVVIPTPSTAIVRSGRELDSSIMAELAHGELVEQVGVCILPSGLARLEVKCVPAAGWLACRSKGEKVGDYMKLISWNTPDQAASISGGSAHIDGYVGAVWEMLVPMSIKAGKDTSTAEIDFMPAGSMVLQPGLPLKKKGCMRVCPENRLLPAVQGWVTPMGRAGDGGNEVRYLKLISTSGPALPPPPLPHPPSSCRPMHC
jgi:hypothetical protein